MGTGLTSSNSVAGGHARIGSALWTTRSPSGPAPLTASSCTTATAPRTLLVSGAIRRATATGITATARIVTTHTGIIATAGGGVDGSKRATFSLSVLLVR